MKSKIILTTVIMLFTFMVNANNIQVSNISLDNQNIVAHTVDINWDNSWKTNLCDGTINWDASQVFIKYRENIY